MKLADKIKAIPFTWALGLTDEEKGHFDHGFHEAKCHAAELATAHDALMQQMANSIADLLAVFEKPHNKTLCEVVDAHAVLRAHNELMK